MNYNFKKDFPIFKNNPDLIFFDSTSTSQKPSYVIDWIKSYLENSYSNIHRWMYDLSIESENLYKKSKQIISWTINASDYKEIIYTHNSTYAINLLVTSIKKTWILTSWDKVLLSIAEHHANIVPWLILKEEIWIEIDYIWVDENYDLDIQDFEKKYDSKTKIISLTHVSNVTGQIFDLQKIWELKRENTLFIVDASQSIPHFEVDVKSLNCDALFFTGHKVFSDSWVWVLWAKSSLLNNLKPSFSWGGAIWDVFIDSYTTAQIPDKFEPGTPNVTWAVSILRAFEYVQSIWGFAKIHEIEDELVEYFLEKLNNYKQIQLIWSKNSKNRVGVFSLVIWDFHSDDVAEVLAENNIAVRSWKHCAHPLLKYKWINNSLRVSFYIYNDKSDIDKFFEVIDKIISK